MAFASVTDHNVIKWLPSVGLYVRSAIGNSVKNVPVLFMFPFKIREQWNTFSMHKNVLKQKGKCSP